MRADFLEIDEHGLIGDMSSAALVGIDGSIVWCCMPRFDSPSVFASLLDRRAGGSFRIGPADVGASAAQSYLPDTNILRTSFTTATGAMAVTDFMPVRRDALSEEAPREIHRTVRCDYGEVDVECAFEPRLDYARGATELKPLREGAQARGGRQTLNLLTDVPLDVGDGAAVSKFSLRQGETASFVVAYGRNRPLRLRAYRTEERLEDTRKFWRDVAAGIEYDGLWPEAVTRSLLTLRLMMYRRTGAIVAAPTTSLPETLGGSRNWDYRFSWLRDTSFTVDILYRMGHEEDGDRYVGWLLDQCKLNDRRTRIVYGVSPNSSLRERTLDHLEGYAGSRPVRIGNGASRHLQLDVF